MDDILHYPDNIGSVNEGWADAMARILFKNLPEGKVLSSDNYSSLYIKEKNWVHNDALIIPHMYIDDVAYCYYVA